MISILLISLACSLVYSLWLWIHNNLAEQMIKSKDIMILNLQQQNRMQGDTIDRLRSCIRRHRSSERRFRKLSKEGINLSK
ncbi:hypothetical protein [Dysgonomonas capnocytophagoides]|uniref:hypothetical protein n=1 Tax=Dysgonomonas capnocytophagoides TaxID=45254 RepID=UPI00333E8559